MNTKTQPETKICLSCQKEISFDTTKCPYCGKDFKSWFKRHPILTIILALFTIPPFLGGLFSNFDKSKSQTPELKKEVASPTKQVSKAPFQVKEDLSSILNEANQKIGFQFYKKVRVEEQGAYWVIFTISDDWYNLGPYLQERLVKITVNYYKEIEEGLNPYAEISLEDQFGKEVATGYYSVSGIKTNIIK